LDQDSRSAKYEITAESLISGDGDWIETAFQATLEEEAMFAFKNLLSWKVSLVVLVLAAFTIGGSLYFQQQRRQQTEWARKCWREAPEYVKLAVVGQWKEAIKILEREAQTRPKDVEPYILIGCIYEQQGHYPAALRAYKRGLARAEDVSDDPYQILLYQQIGRLCEKTRQWECALKAYQQVLRLYPSDGIVFDRTGTGVYVHDLHIPSKEVIQRKVRDTMQDLGITTTTGTG